MRSQWSAWSRRIGYAVVGTLALIYAGDTTRAQTSINDIGIDPFGVLDLQVKATAVIALDSSGSMREDTATSGLAFEINVGELVGDDPNSKLAQSKAVLRNIIQQNDHKMRFRFGRYTQNTLNSEYDGGEFFTNRFYYVTTNPLAANIGINMGQAGSATPGISRNRTTDGLPDHRDIAGVRHYYVRAGRWWNGQTIDVASEQCEPAVNCTTGVVKTNPATVTLNSGATNVTFTYAGVNWNRNNNLGCNGFEELAPLANCDVLNQFDGLLEVPLRPEATVLANGDLSGYSDGALGGAPASMPANDGGIRASGGTPITRSIRHVRCWFRGNAGNACSDAPAAIPTPWPTPYYGTLTTNPKPRTILIFVTDGDDQCQSGTLDENALAAAYQAQLLYQRSVAADPASSVTTYFIVYGGAASVARGDWVAWGGSGFDPASVGITITGTGSDARWSRAPTPAEVASTCPNCVNAFSAQNSQQLFDAIQAAIDQGQSSGVFAASPTIAESVYEFGRRAGVDIDPTYPGAVPTATEPNPAPPPATVPKRDRYRAFVPIVIQPTFDASNFGGEISAYADDGPDGDADPDLVWQASAKLAARINIAAPSTFALLHGGAGMSTIGSGGALIKRRIFTTSRNGVFSPTVAGEGALAQIWPPTTAGSTGTAPSGNGGNIAPANDTTRGWFDYALGVDDAANPDETAKFNDLFTRFGACAGTGLPGSCTGGTVTSRFQRARREAREMILAYTAGAVASSGATGPARNGAGDILYIARTSGLMAESTLAVPAIITPPLEDPPAAHSLEYLLFRDGSRSGTAVSVNRIDEGFGLRNGDKDRTLTTAGLMDLKPTMTVAYVATNHMLHALRAGPCNQTDPTTFGVCRNAPAAPLNVDRGGEELWGFVPYDQLAKLAERMKPQARDPHTYVIAASPRFADIFIPDPFSLSDSGTTVNYTGRWRTVLYFGRGIAGKYITALDVTTPGPFTRSALASNLVLPTALWNRGNPDIGATVRTCAEGGHATTPCDEYRDMGQTWSVPAIVPVDSTIYGGVEWVAYVGSGFSDQADEGKRFYALNAITGDVLASEDVGSVGARSTVPNPNPPPAPATLPFNNALVASPVAYIPARQSGGFVGNSVGGIAERVFISDLHGRVFRFKTSDATATGVDQLMSNPVAIHDLGNLQPVTTAVGLLGFNSDAVIPPSSGPGGAKPHIYVVTGGDRRVRPPGNQAPFTTTPPFKMVGLRDDDGGADSATVLFSEPLNPTSTTGPGFRGTVAPVVLFNDQQKPRVFFAGTQFTPPGTACASRLDSILFALTGVEGDAAYDLSSGADDAFILFNNQLINQLQVMWEPDGSGTLAASTGIGAGGAPPKPPSPPDESGDQQQLQQSVFTLSMKMGSPVCR